MSAAWDTPPPAQDSVERFLDRVRPAIVADGGNVELLSVEHDGTVRVAFQGTCLGCPARLATLRIAIEEPLRKAVGGVRCVVAVG